MAVDKTIQTATVGELLLDPKNPRLGRGNIRKGLRQEEILRLMEAWNLEELAVSFLRSGFWIQEALMVTKETVPGISEPGLVVIEGNRRLAALKLLYAASRPDAPESKWKKLLSQHAPPADLFSKVPYLRAVSRSDIEAFLGFRHVTGIMQWHPAEKAEFIAKLIDDHGLSYEEVMQMIGSKTASVRQNYIAFNLLRQMEGTPNVDIKRVEDKFSVLFLSLRTPGVREYLNIDMDADVDRARHPVKKSNEAKLAKLARWLFGDAAHPAVLRDSREIDEFGRVLQNAEGRSYLESTERPKLEVASQVAGVGLEDLIQLIDTATDNVQLTQLKAPQFISSDQLRGSVLKLARHVEELQTLFQKS